MHQNFSKQLLVCCALVVLLGAVVSFAGYQKLGVISQGDSTRYISGAKAIAQGGGLNSVQNLFQGYIYLLRGVFYAGGTLGSVLLIQCLFSVLAGVCLCIAGARLFGLAAGLLAACLFLCSPEIQRWNFYILTDSLANSLLVIVLCLAVLSSKNPRWCGLLVPAMVWFAFMRPESYVLLLCTLFLVIRKPLKTALPVFVALGLIWIFFHGSSAGNAYNMALHWDEGTVIWGHKASNLPPPVVLEHAPRLGLAGTALQYLVAYPLWAINLTTHRLFWFCCHARPFYSPAHNLLAVFQSVLLLVALLYAVWRYRLKNIGVAMVLGLVLLQSAVVALTHADWDGRHFTRIAGPLLLLASAAMVDAFGWLKSLLRPKD